MKKTLSLIFISVVLLSMSACSVSESSKSLSKEGIAPYKLSEDEKYLLESYRMTDNSQMILFNAPEEAITFYANAYRLSDDNTWETIGSGGISIGEEREPVKKLSGNFTMQLREDYSIDFGINCGGHVFFKSDAIEFEKDNVVSSKFFLQEYQKIELDTEIPVALMVYDSGNIMRAYSASDYFEPSKFEGMDLVQVVTLKFTDKEL